MNQSDRLALMIPLIKSIYGNSAKKTAKQLRRKTIKYFPCLVIKKVHYIYKYLCVNLIAGIFQKNQAQVRSKFQFLDSYLELIRKLIR